MNIKVFFSFISNDIDCQLIIVGDFGSAEHIIEKSLKNIKEEAKWSEENLPVIEKWLNNFLSSTNNDKFVN